MKATHRPRARRRRVRDAAPKPRSSRRRRSPSRRRPRSRRARSRSKKETSSAVELGAGSVDRARRLSRRRTSWSRRTSVERRATGEAVEATADGAPKKKRTRRGTRGGRVARSRTPPRRRDGADETPDDAATVVPRSRESTCRRPISSVAAVAVEAAAEPIAPDGRADGGACRRGRRRRRRSAEAQALATWLARRQEAAQAGGGQRRCGRVGSDDLRRASLLRTHSCRRPPSATASLPSTSRCPSGSTTSSALPRVAAIMRRFCGPPARFDLPRKP